MKSSGSYFRLSRNCICFDALSTYVTIGMTNKRGKYMSATEKLFSESSKTDDAFAECLQSIRALASGGVEEVSVYTENAVYKLDLGKVAITAIDGFSYAGDGAWARVSIAYEKPNSEKAADELTFSDHDNKVEVRFGGKDQRKATIDDLLEFNSFLAHAKAAQENEKQEAQVLLERERDQRELKTYAVRLANAAIEAQIAANKLKSLEASLAEDGGRLARMIAELEEDALLDILVESGEFHYGKSAHNTNAIMHLRESAIAIIESET